MASERRRIDTKFSSAIRALRSSYATLLAMLGSAAAAAAAAPGGARPGATRVDT
eukprot:SAG31_NODE_2311_length_5958_cov_4.534221_4_plen_54_part_00